MSVDINNTTKSRINKKELQDIFSRFLNVINLHKKSTASLAFISSAEIKKLNKKYRKLNCATDVLSFADPEPVLSSTTRFRARAPLSRSRMQKEPYFLGEIVICPKVAKLPIPVLVTHALLHLIGYVHDNEKKAHVMEELEEKIL